MAAPPQAMAPPVSGLARCAPAWGWLRTYPGGWIRGDVAAGITLAAYLLPAALGDASLAGLPPQAGLYACLFSGLVFWAFCSSRQTAITTTSAISLLVGSSLSGLAGGDPARFGALAACTALLVALLAFLAWLVRAGVVVNFISETVLIGFKCGVALWLAGTQLPKLLGLRSEHGGFLDHLGEVVSHLGETNLPSLALGGGALGLLLLGRRFLPHKPVGLVVLVAGIAVASQADLGRHGVELLGEVPRGLPILGLPAVHGRDLNDLLPLALACFLLGTVETVAIGKMFAQQQGRRFDSNQEFLALAAANLTAGLGRGYPVGGGISQSLVNESAGARTPVSGLVAAGLILVVAVFFSGLLRHLPQPVLAAIVLMAVTSLFNLSALRHLWRAHRGEFLVALAALLGVMVSGLLRGVLLGVIVSGIMLLRRTSLPHVAVLGRIPGTRRFSDLARHTNNERVPGMLIFRVEASLLYFNIEHVRGAVWAQIRATAEPVRLVVCDLSNSPYVDLAGAEMLKGLHDDLAKAGIELRLVEAHAEVRDLLRLEGLEEKVGPIDRFASVADVVDHFLKETKNSS